MATSKKPSRVLNFGKSIAFGLGNAVKEKTPGMASIVSDENKEFMNDVLDTLAEIRKGQIKNAATKMFTDDKEGKEVLDQTSSGWKNLKEGLDNLVKKGQIGRDKEAVDKEQEKAFFGGEDLNFDFDSDDNELDKLLKDEDLDKPVSASDKQAVAIGSAQLKATNDTTKVMLNVGRVNSAGFSSLKNT